MEEQEISIIKEKQYFEKETILLTGSTGYIGSQIAKVFVENCLGEYNIRIAVRSLAEKKHEALRHVFGDSAYS